MKHQFVYFPQQRLFYLRTWGPSSVDGFRAYFLEQLEDPRLGLESRILADHRRLEFKARGSAGVRQLADVLRPHAQLLGGVRMASVVTSNLQFGLTRMWEALSELADVPLDHIVARELHEAVEHLGLGPEFTEELEALPPVGDAVAKQDATAEHGRSDA